MWCLLRREGGGGHGSLLAPNKGGGDSRGHCAQRGEGGSRECENGWWRRTVYWQTTNECRSVGSTPCASRCHTQLYTDIYRHIPIYDMYEYCVALSRGSRAQHRQRAPYPHSPIGRVSYSPGQKGGGERESKMTGLLTTFSHLCSFQSLLQWEVTQGRKWWLKPPPPLHPTLYACTHILPLALWREEFWTCPISWTSIGQRIIMMNNVT